MRSELTLTRTRRRKHVFDCTSNVGPEAVVIFIEQVVKQVGDVGRGGVGAVTAL